MWRLRSASETPLARRVHDAARRFARAARLAVGIPDYEAYVAHRRQHHPGEPVMSYEEFFRERVGARYRKGSSRCC